VGVIDDLEECLKIKTGSYFQFVGTIEDIVNETNVEIQSLKAL
jgi:hypothetical protein